jgi:hypothetical protein
LTIAAIGLAIALVVFGSTASSDRPPCRLESKNGKIEIKFSSDSVNCAESRRVYARYTEAAQAGKIDGIYEALEAEGWNCQRNTPTQYPLMTRCRQRTRYFDVVGLTPIVHTNQELSSSRSSEPVSFQTPTGTIACQMSRHEVHCDIFARDWTPPPRPKDCAYPWGHSIELQSSGSKFICGGTAILPDGESGFPILRQGNNAKVGPFTCAMRKQGLVCGADGEQGFLLSFQRIKLF